MSESVFTLLSVGAIVSTLFLVLELFLLPLFELVREKLSIACVRRIIKSGDQIILQEELPILSWFGVADGISYHSASLNFSRFLKVTLKLSILASPFVFEYHIGTETLATPIQLFFPSKLKPLSEKITEQESWIIAPVPVEGLEQQQVIGLVPFGRTEAVVSSRNYTTVHLPGFDLEYIAHCTSRINGRQEVYAGVLTTYNRPKSVDGFPSKTLACLNGIQGRPKVVLMSYGPDSTRTRSANCSSVFLIRKVASDFVSNMYESRVTMLDGSTLVGFVVLTRSTHIIKDVVWSMYGLLSDSRTNNIVRLNIPLMMSTDSGVLCNETSLQGIWRRNGMLTNCPNGRPAGRLQGVIDAVTYKQNQFNFTYADVQYIGLRLGNSTDLVSIGNPINVARALIAETKFYQYQAPERFTEDIRMRISTDLFYYSVARKRRTVLRLGRPRQYTTLNKVATISLISVIAALLLYSFVSCFLELRSRVVSQIGSQCFTRDGLLSMLREQYRGNSISVGLVRGEDCSVFVGVISQHRGLHEMLS